MFNRLRSFDIVCRCLAEAAEPRAMAALRAVLRAQRVDWGQVIEAAAEHYVLPLLWRRLVDKDLAGELPQPVADLLQDLHARNAVRNARLRTQLIEIGASLQAAGLEALLLKGSNCLLLPEHRRGDRMMVDIDLLVPSAGMTKALAALQAMGYGAFAAADGDASGFHQPPLHKPGTLATVELHTHIGEQTHILDAAAARSQARSVLPGLAAPSPTHRIIHNVFHAAAQNRGPALAVAALKDLCDFTTIAREHAAAIDWMEIRRRFAKQPALLDAHVGLAARLLGWVPPPELGTGWRRAAPLLRTRLHLRIPALRHITGLWAAASYPFRRTRVEYVFGPCSDRAALLRYRLHLLRDLLRRHPADALAQRFALAWAHYRHHQAARRW